MGKGPVSIGCRPPLVMVVKQGVKGGASDAQWPWGTLLTRGASVSVRTCGNAGHRGMPPPEPVTTGNWCPAKPMCRGLRHTPHMAKWAAECCVGCQQRWHPQPRGLMKSARCQAKRQGLDITLHWPPESARPETRHLPAQENQQ